MATYCLFSGFEPDIGFPDAIAQRLRALLSVGFSLAYIASTPDNAEKNDFYSQTVSGWLEKIDIPCSQISLIDAHIDSAAAIDIINNADAVYLSGGDPFQQLKFLHAYALIEPLRRHNGVIMGLSAGMMNMCGTAIYTADEDCPNTHLYEGIGLVGITVEPHFSKDNEALLQRDLFPHAKDRDIYCLCDDAAIIVQDARIECIGEAYIARMGQISPIADNP